MHEIRETEFGYHLTFSKKMDAEEMREWKRKSERILTNSPAEFGVFVDMRELRVLDQDAKEVMMQGQQVYREAGMRRSVVILASSLVTIQFRSIAKDSGIYEYERYVDASETDDWKEVGLRWIVDGIDPAVDADRPTQEPLPMSSYSTSVTASEESPDPEPISSDGGYSEHPDVAQLEKRFERLESEVGQLDAKIDEILAGVNSTFGRTKQTIAEMNEEVNAVSGELEEVRTAVEDVRDETAAAHDEAQTAREEANEGVLPWS